MLPRNHLDRIQVAFDDHRLVDNAGLLLPATLALHLGLSQLVQQRLDLGDAPGRANTGDNIMTLVASALAGGDCIDDADALRTGGDGPDRGMYGVLWRDKSGYLQVGLGFRPGFGQQPDPAPEPSPVQRAPEPGDAMPDYADGPSWLLRAAAMSGRQRPGRRAQAAGGNPPVIGVFHPGPVGQSQQCCHRQDQPMAGYSLRIGPASLLPLPAQALERLEPQLDPEAQRIPTHPGLVRGKAGQDDPGPG